MGGEVLAALLGVVGAGSITAVVTWWLGRGRDRAAIAKLRGQRDQAHADAAAAITAAATTLLAPLQARIDHLEELVQQQRAELQDLRPLRGEVDRLRGENARLHAQVRGLRADLEERTGERTGGRT